MTRLVLASASPRRREMLARLGFAFNVQPADIEETIRTGEAPAETALRLAWAKAEAVASAGIASLGADTVVIRDGRILDKPTDAREAQQALGRLSGAEHEVVTAVTLTQHGQRTSVVVSTRVWFRALEPEEIRAYAAKPEPLGAAGGYAIQGGGAPFVARVLGSFSNVVGLPMAETARLLQEAGVR